jgi:large subunit ribosomal protein L4
MLSSKAGDGGLRVLDKFEFEAPKTKQMLKVLEALKLDSTALVVTASPEVNVVKSARNIPGVKTLPANILNVVDLLSYQWLLMTEEAVRKAEEIWGKRPAQEGTDATV